MFSFGKDWFESAKIRRGENTVVTFKRENILYNSSVYSILELKRVAGDIVSLNEVRFVNIRIIKTKYRQESFCPVF